MLVFICGIAGVGKTTIAQLVEGRGPIGNVMVERVRAHLILCELAGVESVREYRRLSENIRRTYQPEMFRRVYEIDQNDPKTVRLFDRHISSWDPLSGDLRIRSIREDDPERVRAFVLLTAEPDMIFRRRIRDYRERFDRHLFSPYTLAQAQIIEIETTQGQANLLKAPLLCLTNNDSEAEDTCSKVKTFLIELIVKEGG